VRPHRGARPAGKAAAIERHLAELDRALRVPRRLRLRILAEAEDHLREAAAHDGESAAVAAFGPVETVAHRFHEQLGARAARRCAATAALAAAAAALLVALLAGASLAVVPAQLALVAAGVTALRALRHLRAPAIPAGTTRLIVHGGLLAAGACALCAIGDPLAAAPALPAVLAAMAAQRRLRVLDPAGAARADGLAELPLAPLAMVLRRHPWRACAAVALAAGLAVAGGHAVMDGGSAITLARVPLALAAAAVIAAIEAAAVAACFAAFGRWLGLR
jgi:hypothetical protein